MNIVLDVSAAIEMALNMYNAKLLMRDKKLAKISAEMNIEVISY